MTMPEKSLITFLFVTDLEASHRFYADALDLPMVLDQVDCRIYRINSGAFLGICERPDRVGAPGTGLIVTVVTDDVAGTHERLVTSGVAVEHPPAHSDEYHITHAFYRDPDGHVVEVQRFDDPDWASP